MSERIDVAVFMDNFYTEMGSVIRLKNRNKSRQALQLLDKQTTILKKIIKTIPELKNSYMVYNMLYIAYKNYTNILKRQNAKRALEYAKLAEGVLHDGETHIIRDDERTIHNNNLCDYCLNYGQVLRQLERLQDAEASYKQGLELLEKLELNGKKEYVGYEIKLIMSIGNLYIDRKLWQEALKYFIKAEELVDEMCERNEDVEEITLTHISSSKILCYRGLNCNKDAFEEEKKLSKQNINYNKLAQSTNIRSAQDVMKIKDEINNLLDRDKCKQALPLLNLLIEREPNDAKLYADRSYCYGELKDSRNAAYDLYRTIINLYKSFDDIKYNSENSLDLLIVYIRDFPLYFGRFNELSLKISFFQLGWMIKRVSSYKANFVPISGSTVGRYGIIEENSCGSWINTELMNLAKLHPDDDVISDSLLDRALHIWELYRSEIAQNNITSGRWSHYEIFSYLKEFVFWDGTDDELERLMLFFPPFIVVNDLLLRAASYGNKRAWEKLAEFYKSYPFFPQADKVASKCMELANK